MQFDVGSCSQIVVAHATRRAAFAQVLSGVLPANSGQVKLASYNLADLSERDIASRIAYVGPNTFLFNSALTYNLSYGLNHQPPTHNDGSVEELAQLQESALAGNGSDWFDESFATTWADYDLLGQENWQAALPMMVELLEIVGVREVIATRSLQEHIDPILWRERLGDGALDRDLLAARVETRKRIAAAGLAHLVTSFASDSVNPWSSYAENILFGVINVDGYSSSKLAALESFSDGLQQAGCFDDAVRIGTEAARALLMLRDNLPDGHDLRLTPPIMLKSCTLGWIYLMPIVKRLVSRQKF